MVAYITKLEDITGLEKPSEDIEQELEDADTLDMLPERRRMVTEVELKLARWFQSEHDGLKP